MLASVDAGMTLSSVRIVFYGTHGTRDLNEHGRIDFSSIWPKRIDKPAVTAEVMR